LAALERMYEKTLSTDADWQPQLRDILKRATLTQKVAFVGVGHPMRGDDFVGSFIIKALMTKRIGADKLVLFDAEDGIEWVMSRVREPNPKHLIILDACEMNANPGKVALIPLAQTNYPFFTTHGIPLKLLVTKLLPSVDSSILAIQPARMGFNEGLSSPVLAAALSISNFVETTLKGSEPNV